MYVGSWSFQDANGEESVIGDLVKITDRENEFYN